MTVRAPIRYRTHDVPVDGGNLRVGEWGPQDCDSAAAPTVIAVHGITASHLAWVPVAQACPQMRINAGYDLSGAEPHLRPSASLAAVQQDSLDLYGGGVVLEALSGWRR